MCKCVFFYSKERPETRSTGGVKNLNEINAVKKSVISFGACIYEIWPRPQLGLCVLDDNAVAIALNNATAFSWRASHMGCCPCAICACRACLLRQRMVGCANSIMLFQLALLLCLVNRVALIDRFGHDNPFLALRFMPMSTHCCVDACKRAMLACVVTNLFRSSLKICSTPIFKLPFQTC